MKWLLLLLMLLLSGCLSQQERRLKDAKLRHKTTSQEAQIQSLEIEACESRRRHAHMCANRCKHSRNWHRLKGPAR